MFSRRRNALKYLRLTTFIAFLLGSTVLLAQDGSVAPQFSFAAGAGVTMGEVKDGLKYSSWGFVAGAEYGPVVDIEGALLDFSLESGYGSLIRQHETSFFQSGWPSSMQRISRVPVMGWCTVRTANTISPFVRFGGGVAWSEFAEDFTRPGFPSVRITDWGFAWGIGGGIRVQVDTRVAISLYLDDWITTEDIFDIAYLDSFPPAIIFPVATSTYRGVSGPIKLTQVGFRGSFSIF